MFEGDILSSKPIPSRYLKAGAKSNLSRLRTAEDGPLDYQNPILGADYQEWRMFPRDMQFWIESDTKPAHSMLPDPCRLISNVSFCFNYNADLHLLYVEQGSSYFQWYDTVNSRMEIMKLPEGTRDARITLDDKRPSQSSRSDIILSYLDSAGALKFRKQRDRFEVEYLLDIGPYISIEKMYMNINYRLQWDCVVGTWIPLTPTEVLKPYVRYLLTPKHHASYSGYIKGEFDTGYVLPPNQTLDTYTSELEGMYWTNEEFTLSFDRRVSPINMQYCYVYINGLTIKAYAVGTNGNLFKAVLTPSDLDILNQHGGMSIQTCVLFPDTTNATQEF